MVMSGAVSLAQAQPPVEAFAELPNLTQPRLSPDGAHMAAIQSYEGRPIIAIYEVGTGKPPVAVPSSEWVIDSLHWVKNNRLMVYVEQGKRVAGDNILRTWGRAIAISPDGSGVVAMLRNNPSLNFNVGVGVADLALDDPEHVYMPLYVANSSTQGYRYELHKVDVMTGKGERHAWGKPETTAWFMDGKGNVVGRLDEEERPLVDKVMRYADGEWSELKSYESGGGRGAGVIGLSEDGKSLVRLASDARAGALIRLDLATGKDSILYSHPNYDISSAAVDEWTGRIVGARYMADTWQTVYFDPERQKLQNGLQKAFPGRSVEVVSATRALDKVIAMVEGPRHPPAFYFLDRTTHQADEIGRTYRGLAEADLGEMKPYPYKARDGLDIPAYITLPPGKTPRNLPAVVMPHGGPDSRDVIGFDWWAQFLANRGYVVLQPNFRGSLGYGRAFTQAGLQQWGLKMQDDITDGVKKMIADGIVDPKRVCIVGASYGGYAALAGAAFTPDLYACAVSVAGVSDLPDMIRSERKRHGANSDAVSFWISRIGSLSDDTERLRATSPARHADKVTAPVLLMHGKLDTTVPVEQSELMFEALEDAGKPVVMVTFDDDDHYLKLASTRLSMLTQLEKFLAQHIGR
jgi:dipeptidyl aminopeptidase/acylaminoacyl peptidase